MLDTQSTGHVRPQRSWIATHANTEEKMDTYTCPYRGKYGQIHMFIEEMRKIWIDTHVHRGKYGWIHTSVEEKRKIWMATHVRRGKDG